MNRTCDRQAREYVTWDFRFASPTSTSHVDQTASLGNVLAGFGPRCFQRLLPHHKQTAVGSHRRALKSTRKRAVDQELKGSCISPTGCPPPHHPSSIQARIHQGFCHILSNW